MFATAALAAISIFGSVYANYQESLAEEQNAAWLEEQADFIDKAAQREAEIFQREAKNVIGSQVGGYLKSGVKISGSALSTINESFALMDKEIEAIWEQRNMRSKEARLKASSSRSHAKRLRGFGYNALQSGTTALTSYTGYMAASGGFKDKAPKRQAQTGGYTGQGSSQHGPSIFGGF